MKKILYVCLFLLCFISFNSCKSVPKRIENSIYIMIYDYENNAIKDVLVSENGKEKGYSDIYGRFILEKSSENPKIQFSKKGYDTLEVEMSDTKNQVLYIKLGSGYYYASLSEKYFDEEDYESAYLYIQKALSCEKRKDYEYLKEIILKKKG